MPSLAVGVNKAIQNFMTDPLVPIQPIARKPPRPSEAENIRAKLAGKKLANGDVKGAIRVLSSNDSLLPSDPSTLSTLESKHPPRHPDSEIPNPPNADQAVCALPGLWLCCSTLTLRSRLFL